MIRKKRTEYLKQSQRHMLNAPLISQHDFEKKRKKKLRGALLAYLFTMTVTAMVAVALMISCAFEYNRPYLSGGAFSLAKMIINSSFMDISFDRIGESSLVGDVVDVIEGILKPSDKIPDKKPQPEEDSKQEQDSESVSKDNIYDFDYSEVPDGETPVIPMDLSMYSYGSAYIHNSTGLAPDTDLLLNEKLKDKISLEYLSSSSSPTVLIIHTHGTESYCEDGAISIKENGEIARSDDTDKNIVSVGRVFKDALKKQGINSIHCEIMHDVDGFRDSYTRAESTIRQYLDRYPTIRLVVDLHRDAVVKSNGEIVRPVTVVDGKAVAQVMCVVGSNWGGEANDRWEGNLALALKLREVLNSNGNNICRPAHLKESTYNQEFAPYSLLIEVGACGNSLEEAKSAAALTANAISQIILKK